jgi:hypothetical protein
MIVILSIVMVTGISVKAAPVDDDCTDVFDKTASCSNVDDTPLADVSEAMGPGGLDFTPVEIDATTVGLQLLAVAASVATLAVAFHGAQIFYALHYLNTRDAGELTADEASRLTTTNAVVGGLALVSWLSSLLIAGTGVALFVYDPKDGSVAPLFQGGGE